MFKHPLRIAALTLAALMPATAHAACPTGLYRGSSAAFVILSPMPGTAPGQRYTFDDGRRSSTADADALAHCVDGAVAIAAPGKPPERWTRQAFTETPIRFDSAAAASPAC